MIAYRNAQERDVEGLLKKFSVNLQGEHIFPPIPKRKGPFIRELVRKFEQDEDHYSPSGETAHILMAWCVYAKQPYELRYVPGIGYRILTGRKMEARA